MNWFRAAGENTPMEKELDVELRFHFKTQVADKIRAGMSEAEARRETRLEFGGLDQVKEECRESRGTLWLLSVLQDVRFGARILAKSPGFSLTAIAVLALGIGVSTFAFSLFNTITLESIPVRDRHAGASGGDHQRISCGRSISSIAYYRDNAKSLSAVVATMPALPRL